MTKPRPVLLSPAHARLDGHLRVLRARHPDVSSEDLWTAMQLELDLSPQEVRFWSKVFLRMDAGMEIERAKAEAHREIYREDRPLWWKHLHHEHEHNKRRRQP